MNTLDLVKKLIIIPSFVDEVNNEIVIAKFLINFIEENFSDLKTEKQYIEDTKRYNILAKGSENPELLIVGHMDTVQPNIDWSKNPLQPIIKQGKLYGLGVADMKGSIASCLVALEKVKDKIDMSKLMLFFYIDEEYDFKGMKKFIEKPLRISPKVVFNLDGDKEVSSGCRGLIEIKLAIRGKSYHASKPFMGVNVIRETTKIIDELEKEVERYNDKYLGPTSVNLAYMQASTVFKENGKLLWQQEGNIIPDFAEIILELRPAVKEVTANFVFKKLENYAKKYSLRIENVKIRHDIRPWPVSFATKTLKEIYKRAHVPFKTADIKFSGYVDTQMLAEKVNCPIFVIGTGGNNTHGADENVPLKNLKDAGKIYEQIFLTYCKK